MRPVPSAFRRGLENRHGGTLRISVCGGDGGSGGEGGGVAAVPSAAIGVCGVCGVCDWAPSASADGELHKKRQCHPTPPSLTWESFAGSHPVSAYAGNVCARAALPSVQSRRMGTQTTVGQPVHPTAMMLATRPPCIKPGVMVAEAALAFSQPTGISKGS